MGRILSLIAIIAGICYPSLLAHQIPWQEPYEYDFGFNPSIAMSITMDINFQNVITVVETHNGTGQYGPLWYRVGQVCFGYPCSQETQETIQWGPPYQYDVGFNPKVAMQGTTVVEVHNGTRGDGPLWYRVGQIDASTQKIQWGPPNQYDTGYNPSVALGRSYLALGGPLVVEVHNGTGGDGPLWYHMGQIDISTQTIQWGPAQRYDTGFNPSVAFEPLDDTVIEVHNGTGGDGPLWYQAGLPNVAAKTIQWVIRQQYDTGFNPSLALISFEQPDPVLRGGYYLLLNAAEVHNGTGHDGPLWGHLSALFYWTPCPGESCITLSPF